MRRAVLVAAALLLVGCGDKIQPGDALSIHKEPDTITIPLQPARNLYATIRQTVQARLVYAEAKCRRDELSASECRTIAEDTGTARQLDFEIRRGLDNPKAELDVAKIARVLEISAKVVGALTP